MSRQPARSTIASGRDSASIRHAGEVNISPSMPRGLGAQFLQPSARPRPRPAGMPSAVPAISWSTAASGAGSAWSSSSAASRCGPRPPRAGGVPRGRPQLRTPPRGTHVEELAKAAAPTRSPTRARRRPTPPWPPRPRSWPRRRLLDGARGRRGGRGSEPRDLAPHVGANPGCSAVPARCARHRAARAPPAYLRTPRRTRRWPSPSPLARRPAAAPSSCSGTNSPR